MRKLLLRATLAACLASPLTMPAAQAQIYRCQSADGTPLFQNAPGRNCKPMDLPSLTIIPSARVPSVGRNAAAGLTAAPGAGSATASASAAEFPRVGASAQRSRDSDRKRILLDELSREQARLEDLLTAYNGGQPARPESEHSHQRYLERVGRLKDDITRSETSVASLRRELEGVK